MRANQDNLRKIEVPGCLPRRKLTDGMPVNGQRIAADLERVVRPAEPNRQDDMTSFRIAHGMRVAKYIG